MRMILINIKSICLLITFLLTNIFVSVKCQFLGFGANIILCWRCEETECNRYFDFTQHTAEQCDGKCWKSFDIIEAKTKEEREQATETPASRRCFTSDELMKANAIGINTANGCRDIKMREKVKHFCFCDGDMCNGSYKTNLLNLRTILIRIFLIFLSYYLFSCIII